MLAEILQIVGVAIELVAGRRVGCTGTTRIEQQQFARGIEAAQVVQLGTRETGTARVADKQRPTARQAVGQPPGVAGSEGFQGGWRGLALVRRGTGPLADRLDHCRVGERRRIAQGTALADVAQ